MRKRKCRCVVNGVHKACPRHGNIYAPSEKSGKPFGAAAHKRNSAADEIDGEARPSVLFNAADDALNFIRKLNDAGFDNGLNCAAAERCKSLSGNHNAFNGAAVIKPEYIPAFDAFRRAERKAQPVCNITREVFAADFDAFGAKQSVVIYE